MQRALLFFILLGALPATEDMIFTDPDRAAAMGHGKHGRLVVMFCGHCPSARRWMSTDVKELADAVQRSQAPLDIFCVTPELRDTELTSYAQEIGLTGVLLAYDAVNPRKIGLSNIMQVAYGPGAGGKQIRVGFNDLKSLQSLVEDPARHPELGTFRLPPPAGLEGAARAAWWAIEQGDRSGLAALAAASKKAKPGKPADDAVLALVATLRIEVEATLQAAMGGDDSLATYEALELALADAEGYVDTKAGADRLKALGKDKTIATELKARQAYRTCMALLATTKPTDQKNGAAGMQQLAQKYPDTVYGRKAASR